jgi:hypothetical protein
MPGAKVTEIARRHGISRSLLYTWRRAAGREIASEGAPAVPHLVPEVVADMREKAKPPVTIEIALPGGISVAIRGTVEGKRRPHATFLSAGSWAYAQGRS